MSTKRRTATSNFGVGAREGHDASGFYSRFSAPELSTDDTVLPPKAVAEPFVCGDARKMDEVEDGSVALVVTSPPYFAGKKYEEELTQEGIPSSYLEYLELLHDVFAECVRKLEPGGRMAVNVANLGRKPYRSLSADVITILEDLGLLLRGELIWQKGEGASGSCAWGSFRSASNPVLRDVTERVIVASKGRFDRARTVKQREAEGLPHVSTLMTEDFTSLTLDVWSIPPESAKRVGHPAPFPVELPEQLIRLYTYENDLVLDPFMGSGSTMAAAEILERRYIGYDTDPEYVALARDRVAEVAASAETDPALAATTAANDGRAAVKLAQEIVEDAGFEVVTVNARIPKTGVRVTFEATDTGGRTWWFDVVGPFTSHRGGMAKTDVVWKALGRAHVLREAEAAASAGAEAAAPAVSHPGARTPFVLLTTALPKHRSEGDTALRAAGPRAFFDAVDILSDKGRDRLAAYAQGGAANGPLPGFWAEKDLGPT